MQKALRLVEEGNVTLLSGHNASGRSSSRNTGPSNTEGALCPCKDAKHHTDITGCSHIRAVRLQRAMADTQLCNFHGTDIRIIDQEGPLWFVHNAVCEIFGLTTPREACSRRDVEEKDAVGIPDPIGREQTTTSISEAGLSTLTLTSRKLIANHCNVG